MKLSSGAFALHAQVETVMYKNYCDMTQWVKALYTQAW